MAAARHGHNDTVELLLDRGADLGATGSVSQPLGAAARRVAPGATGRRRGTGESSRCSWAHVSPEQRGWQACIYPGGGCYAFLRCVMWCGGYEASQYGTTALTAAAAGGSKDTVELLLDRGADLAAKDSVSQPLGAAA